MTVSPLQRLFAWTLLALFALTPASVGGKSLVVCLTTDDHSHMFFSDEGHRPVSSIVHSHGEVQERPACACDHSSVIADGSAVQQLDADYHGHDCIDISLRGGDLQPQTRKSVAYDAVDCPCLVHLAQSVVFGSLSLPGSFHKPEPVDSAGSPPDVLRTTVLLI